MSVTSSWQVYIVECADGSLYCGISNDLDQRLKAHDTGRAARYTRGRGPVVLRYRESCADRPSALRREAAIKRLTREQKLKLIRTDGQRAGKSGCAPCRLPGVPATGGGDVTS